MIHLPVSIDGDKCNSGRGGGCQQFATTEPHTCPYAKEINDNHEEFCTCCDDCTHECADDI